MGDTDLRLRVAHLYRRAGFGASPQELNDAVAAGYEPSVDRLLDMSRPDPVADALPLPDLPPYPPPPESLPTDPAERAAATSKAQAAARAGSDQLALWWIDRMVVTANPLREKLALFWHGHFATSVQKVLDPGYMYGQNQIFRTQGSGNFAEFTLAVAKDPAMLIWLDAGADRKASPNENFARELLELFTLGIGHYTEADVKEAARSFTGWQLSAQTRAFSFAPNQHDGGPKTFLGQTGSFTGEDVVRMVTARPETSMFVTQKLWSHFVAPIAFDDPVLRPLAANFGKDLDVTRLLRAVFNHARFSSAASRSGLVKQPVEYVAGALRSLGLRAANTTGLLGLLGGLGQVPFTPPNVSGWPQNSYWLNSSTAMQRLRLAAALVSRADLSAVSSVPAARRSQAAADQLGMHEGWRPATARALGRVAQEPAALMTLALVAPEYLMA